MKEPQSKMASSVICLMPGLGWLKVGSPGAISWSRLHVAFHDSSLKTQRQVFLVNKVEAAWPFMI